MTRRHFLRDCGIGRDDPCTTCRGLHVRTGASGLGRLVVDSIENRDFTTVQGAVLTITLIVVMVNVLIDVLYTIIDPRISVSSKE